jgi:predicted nucleic acid-binding protein
VSSFGVLGLGVLVDTPIWSLALRRKSSDLSARESALTSALTDLIRSDKAQLLGVVRQELLSGIAHEDRFRKIRNYLRPFEDPRLEVADYEEAAQMSNRCRAQGVADSPVDFLICATAHRRNWQIFTSDRDFERYRDILGVGLFEIV